MTICAARKVMDERCSGCQIVLFVTKGRGDRRLVRASIISGLQHNPAGKQQQQRNMKFVTTLIAVEKRVHLLSLAVERNCTENQVLRFCAFACWRLSLTQFNNRLDNGSVYLDNNASSPIFASTPAVLNPPSQNLCQRGKYRLRNYRPR